VTDSRKPPIFIVGSPRSGTTLLRSLLSRHPAIAICGETRFFADVYKRRSVFGSLENLENRRRLVDEYLATARVARLDIDLKQLRCKLLDEATSYPAFLAAVMNGFADFHHKPRSGEKTPHHAFFTETLSEWYPGAYLIHIVRDPRDVVASLQRMPWAVKSIWNNAWIWVLFNRAAEESLHRPGYLKVQYEKLVDSPQQELMRICRHIGEEWPDSLDVPTDPSAPYSWPSSAHGPITRSRLQQWRGQLSTEEISVVERIAGKRLEQYGYQPSGRPASLPVMAKALAIGGVAQARERILQLPHAWYYLTQPTKLPLHEYWKYRQAWDAMFPGRLPPAGNRK
jgi:Sulfotransferase family